MADDPYTDLYLLHRQAQDKYTYFLLAAAASCLAFAVQKSDALQLAWSMAPLGVSALVLLGSFF